MSRRSQSRREAPASPDVAPHSSRSNSDSSADSSGAGDGSVGSGEPGYSPSPDPSQPLAHHASMVKEWPPPGAHHDGGDRRERAQGQRGRQGQVVPKTEEPDAR